MQPKHSAIVAGLTLALSFGAVAAPVTAVAEEPTPGVASDATDIDKGLYTQQSFSGVLRSVQGVSFVNVTAEMKYFTKYESHGNYNQGFSYGDGYNALGYYQFDRRWSLIPFMKQVYNYDSAKYGMLKAAIDRGSEISNAKNPMYANGQLTELGRIAQDAFLGAYNTDPTEFSALQDAYAYNSYYAVTEAWFKSALGIDISGRADCVKGMVWSITNMCGTGGCRDFFRWANLSNSMTDREFVTALSNSVVNNVAAKYASQPSITRAGRTATAMSSRIVWSILPRTRLRRQRLWSPCSPSPRRHLRRRLIRMTTRATMPTMTRWMRPRPMLTAMALLVALPTTALPRTAPIRAALLRAIRLQALPAIRTAPPLVRLTLVPPTLPLARAILPSILVLAMTQTLTPLLIPVLPRTTRIRRRTRPLFRRTRSPLSLCSLATRLVPR